MEESSILFTMILMFIGAGSVSTGGGIKLTTFVILITSVLSFFRKKEEIVLFQRTIKMSTVTRVAIAVASQILILAAVFILMLTENFSFIQLLFETISAFGTVGLTMGITAKLSAFGKCIIMFVMFCGLIG